MMARLLRRLLLATHAAAWAFGAALAASDRMSPAAAVLLALALPWAAHAAVLAVEFVLGRLLGSPMPRSQPGGLRPLVGAWLGETRASIAAFCGRMAWRSHRPVPSADAGQRMPVLLLHGYFCNSALWQPMARRLAARGHPVAAIDLEPPFGSIDGYADAVLAAVDALRARTGRSQVTIVAHSMGGLAARAAMRRHGDAAIARLVTLGTPHRGTVLAVAGHGENVAQMRRGSRWLDGLSAAEDAARRKRFTVVLSHHDNIVVPQADQTLAGAKTFEFSGLGHVALASDAAVAALVERELDDAQAAMLRSECRASAAGKRPDRP